VGTQRCNSEAPGRNPDSLSRDPLVRLTAVVVFRQQTIFRFLAPAQGPDEPNLIDSFCR
jgi:hypothetical protein